MAISENPVLPVGAHCDGPDSWEGREYEFPCLDHSTDPAGRRAGSTVRRKVVRNKSSAAILPGVVVKAKADGTADNYAGQVSGVAGADEKGYPADEFLPAAGAADGELFYVVVDGLAKVKSAASGDTNIPVGGAVRCSGSGLVVQGTSSLLTDVGLAAAAVNATSTLFLVDVGGHLR